MKHLIISLLLLGGVIALSTSEASAVVCARGVVRAGCVGAGGGAVVVRHPAVVVAHPVARPAVVVGHPYVHPRVY